MEKLTQITLAWEHFGAGRPQGPHRQTPGQEPRDHHPLAAGHSRARAGRPSSTSTRGPASAHVPPARCAPATKQLVWALREREARLLRAEVRLPPGEGATASSCPSPRSTRSWPRVHAAPQVAERTGSEGEAPEADAPRQVVQMDTVHFGRVFAFTAVDIFPSIEPQPPPASLRLAQGRLLRVSSLMSSVWRWSRCCSFPWAACWTSRPVTT